MRHTAAAASLFEKAGHITGQLLSLENSLKNSDIKEMSNEQLEEKLNKIDMIRIS